MILNSPYYPGLLIYVGERPVAGSFYVPKSSDTLTHMANWAYGSGTLSLVQRINKSSWNVNNCIYRKNSTKFYSPEVNSGLARYQNSFSDGAWVALCPQDTQPWAANLGLHSPVIWLPGPNGEEPEDLELRPEITETSVPSADIAQRVGPQNLGALPPAAPPPEESSSRWPWIVGGIALAGLAVGAVVWHQRRA